MLFFLKSCTTGKVYYLLNNKYVVGRKNCDILIENDQSISRLHAIIRVKKDTVIITDAGSRYSTFRDGEELRPGIEYALKHGNKIQFGLFNSKFMFEQHTFITAVSRLTTTEKARLKNDLSGVRGQLAEYWDDYNCTHLTVKEVGMTMKVLYAVANNAPIVTFDYWSEASKKVAAGEQLPDVNEFCSPPIADELVSSRVEWKKDVNRKGLFKNKMFIFTREGTKKTRMERIILKLGGSCVVACDKGSSVTIEKLKECSEQIVVIQPVGEPGNEAFDKVVRLIKEKKQRLITEQEIGLAILSGSCDKYCNPDFKRVSQVFRNVSNRHVPSRGPILAPDSGSDHFSKKISIDAQHPDRNVMKRLKRQMIFSSSSLDSEVVQKHPNRTSGGRKERKNKNFNIPLRERKAKKEDSFRMNIARKWRYINPLSSIVFTSEIDGVQTENSKFIAGAGQKENLDGTSIDCIELDDSETTDETNASRIPKKTFRDESSKSETVIEKFKNTAEIVPMKGVLKNNAGNREQIIIDDGERNFKQFKKVKPMRPQSKIIENSRSVCVPLRRTTSIRAEEIRLSQSQKEVAVAAYFQFDRDAMPAVKKGSKKFILTQELCI